MKTIATLFFIMFIGITAQAQDTTTEPKVDTVEMTIVTETTYELKLESATEVARLYKMKNSLVKKELQFLTKADKPKMA